ncbi:4-(cytidine 5'-diphospho)-2-C-methyl-D-erythritol kinase [Algicella marina]|uniref:4-diphosphocytidyl-2-C-methyl-D-erythritol kinase n=2 Tax=Algicella marina TaxID=2683284 RepID=A0A6P1T6X8_9RHOB|nr:4-(cytidine 5'-diphospho)-2-C-methyl-D-erythritol kinase [Algicella marina]
MPQATVITRTAAEVARAKVNLCLHVTGLRHDGYHMLDSLVVFPDAGDRVEIEPSPHLSLTLCGPFGLSLSAGDDNLVTLAARLMTTNGGAILLEKNLPVAAGLGGGSADAAAVLRLYRDQGGILPDAEVLARIGADVPVCIDSRPRRMQGIGEILSDIPELPPFWMVLANAGPSVDTGVVFQALEHKNNRPLPPLPPYFATAADMFEWLAQTRNDLAEPAMALQPQIVEVVSALSELPGCALARMSGSGGTCFGLFADQAPALRAAESLRDAHPAWWVVATPATHSNGA